MYFEIPQENKILYSSVDLGTLPNHVNFMSCDWLFVYFVLKGVDLYIPYLYLILLFTYTLILLGWGGLDSELSWNENRWELKGEYLVWLHKQSHLTHHYNFIKLSYKI